MPPPTHRDATPRFLPLFFSALINVINTRVPDAPKGCPNAIEPPCTLILSGLMPNSRPTATDMHANASFISNKSTSSIFHPTIPN